MKVSGEKFMSLLNPENRTDIILNGVNLNGLGLEIGPSYNPIAPKSSGFNIEVMDHLDSEGLRDKYSTFHVDLNKIEEVDYVWSGQSYRELIPKDKHFDYIIASHVIEHTTDFVSFLQDIEDLLTENGVLCLAIPDKRFCFDYFRPITPLSVFIDRHLLKTKSQTVGTISEFYLDVVSYNSDIAWSDVVGKEEVSLIHGVELAKQHAIETQNGEFIDTHNWVFTPSHFRRIVNDLNLLGYFSLNVKMCSVGHGYEFFIQLQKNVKQDVSRLDLLQQVQEELCISY